MLKYWSAIYLFIFYVPFLYTLSYIEHPRLCTFPIHSRLFYKSLYIPRSFLNVLHAFYTTHFISLIFPALVNLLSYSILHSTPFITLHTQRTLFLTLCLYTFIHSTHITFGIHSTLLFIPRFSMLHSPHAPPHPLFLTLAHSVVSNTRGACGFLFLLFLLWTAWPGQSTEAVMNIVSCVVCHLTLARSLTRLTMTGI